MTTCKACGGEYVAGERCPARGDEAHTRGRGRPAYADDERRSVRLEVRLSADEDAEVRAYAERREQPIAEAVRDAVLRAARRATAPTSDAAPSPRRRRAT
jgi:hypothetical protein